ncbi:MAG: hypothetical protein WCT77_00335 [Bacteroidota bacterium]
MKNLLLIFALFVSIGGWSQTLKLNNSTVTIGSTGNITGDTIQNTVVELQPNECYFHYAHSKQSFKDSAVVIAGGTNVQITNASDSLWRVLEMDNITYMLGDTIEVDYSGSYNVFFSIAGYGTNAVDWQVDIAKLSGVITTYANSVMEFTTSGATNKNGGFKVWNIDYEVGDKVWLVISRIAGSGDFTITTSSFYLQQYYAK